MRGVEIGPSGARFTEIAPTMDARAKDGPIRNQIGGGYFTCPEVANTLARRTGSGRNGADLDTYVAGTLGAEHARNRGLGNENETDFLIANALTSNVYTDRAGEEANLVAHSLRAEGFDASEDGTGRGVPLVPAVAPCLTSNYGKQPDSSDTSAGPMPVAFGWNKSDSQTLRVDDETTDALQSSMSGNPAIVFSSKDSGADADEIAPTLRSGNFDSSHANAGAPPAVAFQCHSSNVGEAGTLRKGNGSVTGGVPFVNTSAIRRLTPTECERLQAFSDGWTAVQVRRHKKWCGFLDTSGMEKPCNCEPTIKDADDGPRYRALGNSMTTTVIGWIGGRIERVNGVLTKLEEGAA